MFINYNFSYITTLLDKYNIICLIYLDNIFKYLIRLKCYKLSLNVINWLCTMCTPIKSIQKKQGPHVSVHNRTLKCCFQYGVYIRSDKFYFIRRRSCIYSKFTLFLFHSYCSDCNQIRKTKDYRFNIYMF